MKWPNSLSFLIQYDTAKFVRVKNKPIGLLYCLLQFGILLYIIGYAIIFKKGYQEFSLIESSAAAKVKGVIRTKFEDHEFVEQVNDPNIYRRVWDVSDYVFPPPEEGSFFVATNVLITPNQSQSFCAENLLVKHSKCETSEQCPEDETLFLGNGPMTGQCVEYDSLGNKTCQIQAWCPVESNEGPLKHGALLLDTKKSTVLIKNFISFPKYGVTRRNILDTTNKTYLRNCKYAPDTLNHQCPIFVLEDIVKYAGENYTAMATRGGVIAIIIEWNCNLDFSISRCVPTYTFRRLDEPRATLAKGMNFRYANYYHGNQRTLYKMYGIEFVILVRGSGSKFNLIPLLLNIGSGIGLLAIASILPDLIVTSCGRKSSLYKSKKFKNVNSESECVELADSKGNKRSKLFLDI